MNKFSKKINLLFLALILLQCLASVLVSTLSRGFGEMSLTCNLIASQTIVLLPGIVFCIINRSEVNRKFLTFKKISLKTGLLIVLFTALVMPLSGIANMLSLFFTTNAVAEISDEIYNAPYWVMVLIIGVIGPFCEEFIFRGIVFQGFKESGRKFSAVIVSALFFALMHMNLNQFCYTFVLGVLFAIITEATGTMLGSFIGHATVNCYNVILMIISMQFEDLASKQAPGAASASEIVPMLIFYVLLSCITVPIAIRVLRKICAQENTKQDVLALRRNENAFKGNSLITISGGIAILICICVITALAVVTKMMMN